MTYLVYENRIGFPMRANAVYEFDDLRRATLFARERAATLETEGFTVENFNGHDWIWYATDISSGTDKGYLLQIFLKESPLGDILIPTEDTDAI